MTFGAKADNLDHLRKLYPANVPPFEIIPFERVIAAYKPTLNRINRLVSTELGQPRLSADLTARLAELADTISVNRKNLMLYSQTIVGRDWRKVSLRTSAYSEDGTGDSFAGQYVSFVDVTFDPSELEAYVLTCFASLFSVRVIAYAKARGLKSLTIGGSVVAQKMFYGLKSGVMFTENGQGEVTLAYVSSWRNMIVEGSDATTIKLPKMTLRATGATRPLRQVAAMGLELESDYGCPVDVEWAYDMERVMLLQVRPQTTDTTNYALTWDGTNISENYPGVTLPLTYSFIRGLYAQVYPSFFRLIGMRESTLRNKDWIFNNALGYIDGHVYYRIENWYELVKLIPGPRNQEFFEAMLDPAKKHADRQPKSQLRTLLNPSFIVFAIRFGWSLVWSGLYSRGFKKRFSVTLKQYEKLDWSHMSADAAFSHIKQIRSQLLVMWGVPILNDVRVMIYHGIFKTSLLKGAGTATYLDHLKGLSDRASIKPLQALYELGQVIDRAMIAEKVTLIEDLKATVYWADIESETRAFIELFGGRTPDELKLENSRIGENIWDVLQLAYASKNAHLSTVETTHRANLNHLPVYKRLFARYIIRNLRQAIDYRERFRFNRAQVFGLARRAYLAIGQRLSEAAVIAQPEDVFYLTEDEIGSIVDGHSWTYDYREIVARRQRDYKTYAQSPFRIRVSGYGKIAPSSPQDTTPARPDSDGMFGQPVAPGRVTAMAIVVEAFDPKLDVTNKILIVKHVDPGWTLLLVQAAGVISERGNALSHVAIVSREIGVPAIVGVKGAVARFRSGETLTMDGLSGEITREA